jgi:hypothetical protein
MTVLSFGTYFVSSTFYSDILAEILFFSVLLLLLVKPNLKSNYHSLVLKLTIPHFLYEGYCLLRYCIIVLCVWFLFQLRDLEATVDKKTKELESLHATVSSASCGSPSEDVSIRCALLLSLFIHLRVLLNLGKIIVLLTVLKKKNVWNISVCVCVRERTRAWMRVCPYCHLWADCLDIVGSLTSHNPIGLQGLLGDSFTLWRQSVLPVRYELDCKYCYK